MIVDAILFDGEWDCLDIRLRELDGLVDRVVLVEGTRTHQGAPRQLLDRCLLDHSLLDVRANLKHVIADLPEHPEGREEASVMRAIIQRNAIVDGLDGVPPSGLVLVSDVDEIPRRRDFEAALRLWNQGCPVIAFEMDLFYYRLNLRDTQARWWGPRAVRREFLTYPHNLRCHYERPEDTVLYRSGWHYSWLGSTEEQLEKMQRFSHPELRNPEIANAPYLETCRRLKTVIHNGHLLERIAPDDSFPILVKEDPERFEELVEP